MSTSHTPDREQQDCEPVAETRAHVGAKARPTKGPWNKKSWEKKTRRRVPISSARFSFVKPVTPGESTKLGAAKPEMLADEVVDEPAKIKTVEPSDLKPKPQAMELEASLQPGALREDPEQFTNEQPADEQPADDQLVGERATDEQLTDEQPAKEAPKQATKKAAKQKYLCSPSLEQAFRNLFKLNGGAAWRETRGPIVVFLVLFGVLSLAVVDALPVIDSFNAAIDTAIQSMRGVFDSFVITLTTVGDFLPMAGICLVVCIVLYIGKKWDSLAFFFTNVVLAVVCVQALKLLFSVPRPGDETLVALPITFSFPSAHSFCSLVVLGMIGLLIFRALIRHGISRKVAMTPGIILLFVALLIGISRIYVGVHWPSDVLGGWLLAGAWLAFAGALYTVGSRQKTSHQNSIASK